VFLGLAIELAQYFTGYRYAEIADALANTAGILLVVTLTYLWHYLE
jgi:VanZ family protein